MGCCTMGGSYMAQVKCLGYYTGVLGNTGTGYGIYPSKGGSGGTCRSPPDNYYHNPAQCVSKAVAAAVRAT